MYRRVNAILSTDLVAHLPELRVPVLLVHGTKDHVLPLRGARRMAALLPGGRYHEIRGAGHMPYLSHPAQCNALFEAFFEEVLPAPGEPAHAP
jgi:pimeloyl-ACP methyl ester carboxylesterase